jgi:hypothetical protein
MATQVSTILTAAIASSLANDGGRSELASDTTELIAVVDRKIRQIYAYAGMPKEYGGMGAGDYFAAASAVVLGASPVALPAAAFRHSFVNALGVRVAVVSQADLEDQVAEMPPAVLIRQDKVLTAGRTGDPLSGDTLTVRYTPLPGPLALLTDYIGATTPADAATTVWPAWVGDPFLIDWLARYLALKAGDRDPAEMQALEQDLQSDAALLGQLIGVEATRLTQDPD